MIDNTNGSHQLNRNSATINDEYYSSFPTGDKRDVIKRQLETNFPTKTTIIFGILPILIGLTAIGLQIGLIANQAVNYQIGNGIWGGFFAILNGLVRLNMVRYKSRWVYKSVNLNRNLGVFLNVIAELGILGISAINLRFYRDCSTPQCSASNFAMTISMLSIGIFGTISNITFLVLFDVILFWKATRVQLTVCEMCSDWKYVSSKCIDY